MKISVATALVVLTTASLHGSTYYVNASRPDDTGTGLSWATAKKTIQVAVNVSSVGDSIIVTNGVYSPINTANKAITIKSLNGASVTIIDGGNSSRCASLGTSAAETSTVLIGFTLRNGAGVECNGTGSYAGSIRNCIITNNRGVGPGYGGGAYGGVLYNCLLKNNGAVGGGGAARSTLINCTVVNNNTISTYGGGVQKSAGLYDCGAVNCIVWNNTKSDGTLNNYDFGGLSYTCTLPIPSGEGNIGSIPSFCDEANGDFRLQINSPCLNGGHLELVADDTDLAGEMRIQGGIVDIGAFEFNYAGAVAGTFGLQTNMVGLSGSAQSGISFGGRWVSVSGSIIGHNKSSGFTFSPTGAGRLIFRWNVSSEYYFDTLSFYVDDVLIARISGKNVTWSGVTNTVTEAGAHTFKWEYAKDGDTSVGQDCAWIADVAWTPSATLTVQNGSGDGDYYIGDSVSLSADAPAPFFVFDRWTGDTNGVADVLAATTVFTMPGQTATLTATYTPMLFALAVASGTGSGSYTNGQSVVIAANAAFGKVFYQWVGDTGTVADTTAANTAVRIPGAAVSLTATYRVPLTVNSGLGDGMYPEQTSVGIAADTPPEGMVFDRWTGDTATVADLNSPVTTVQMPSSGATLTATYAYSLPLVLGDGTLAFVKTGVAASVLVAPGAGPSGGPAVCLTNLLDNQAAGVETVVTGAGRIVFQWRVGSEAEADFMLFKADGVTVATYSGKNKPWVAVTNSVSGAGPHTLRWEYAKDDSGAVAPDAAWLDNIVWTPARTVSPTPVPYTWLDQYPVLLSRAGGNYDAAAQADADGDGHAVWQEYVAGSDPTNRASVLTARIELNGGTSRVMWTPDLGASRVYTVEGRMSLAEGAWGPTNGASRFFRVKVALP